MNGTQATSIRGRTALVTIVTLILLFCFAEALLRTSEWRKNAPPAPKEPSTYRVVVVGGYHFSSSREYLEQARELAPDDWRVWADLAALDLREGKREEGERRFGRAVALRETPFSERDRAEVLDLELIKRSPIMKSASGSGVREFVDANPQGSR